MSNKLQIYFQPAVGTSDVKSFTLSCSRFDEEKNQYRRKLTLEKGEYKYKIKKYCDNLDKLLHILELMDLSDRPMETNIPKDKDLYYVKFDDKFTQTSNKAEIQDILDLFEFDKEMMTDLDEYECVE